MDPKPSPAAAKPSSSSTHPWALANSPWRQPSAGPSGEGSSWERSLLGFLLSSQGLSRLAPLRDFRAAPLPRCLCLHGRGSSRGQGLEDGEMRLVLAPGGWVGGEG